MLFLKRLSDLFERPQALRAGSQAKELRAGLVEQQLDNPDKYTFFVPPEARWEQIRHLKTNVGTRLNKALEALEDRQCQILEDVLPASTSTARSASACSTTTPCRIRPELREHPPAQRQLRVPRPAGRGLRIPDQVLRRLRRQEGRRVLHPGRGRSPAGPAPRSPGRYGDLRPHRRLGRHADPRQRLVEESGGNPRNLSLFGQDNNGTTWAICKMNMILHGINASDIRQDDTLASRSTWPKRRAAHLSPGDGQSALLAELHPPAWSTRSASVS